jgi:hypothetical protein
VLLHDDPLSTIISCIIIIIAVHVVNETIPSSISSNRHPIDIAFQSVNYAAPSADLVQDRE